MGVSKNRGYPQIIHLFIGFSMTFSPSILVGFPLFLETPQLVKTSWWFQPI